jgi:hypothetical protein
MAGMPAYSNYTHMQTCRHCTYVADTYRDWLESSRCYGAEDVRAALCVECRPCLCKALMTLNWYFVSVDQPYVYCCNTAYMSRPYGTGSGSMHSRGRLGKFGGRSIDQSNQSLIVSSVVYKQACTGSGRPRNLTMGTQQFFFLRKTKPKLVNMYSYSTLFDPMSSCYRAPVLTNNNTSERSCHDMHCISKKTYYNSR